MTFLVISVKHAHAMKHLNDILLGEGHLYNCQLYTFNFYGEKVYKWFGEKNHIYNF